MTEHGPTKDEDLRREPSPDEIDTAASPDPGSPLDDRGVVARRVTDSLVVGACVVFVVANLHPELVLSSAVPTGGDMGAHVWGPAFLRDYLLPAGRISGWTPDWYAGFPAYQFYMVVPSLLIVALDVGIFGGWAMLIPVAAAAGAAAAAWRAGPGWRRRILVVVAMLVVVAGVEIPYGTAFKMVTILGMASLPVAVYAFGRLADLRFPGPALLSVGSLFFLFDRNFTIYGGNIASTLAGEFAFSISLSLAMLYLGVMIRGARTGRYRALGACLLAVTGLCHLIPAFFALVGTAVILAAPVLGDAWRACTGARADGPVPVRFWRNSVAFRWMVTVLPVAGALSAFWVLPFLWQRAYVNDMGWVKLPEPVAENGLRSWSGTLFTFDGETYWKYLIPRSSLGSPDDLRWVLALALLGFVLSIFFRVRFGLIMAALAVVMGAAFVFLPQARLWNARLLPFYYLCLYLLAAVGVAEIGRTISVLAARDPDRPSPWGSAAFAGVVLLFGLVMLGLPLRSLPGGSTKADNSYTWLGLTNGVGKDSFLGGWARWNYSGYEAKGAYGEYRDLITTMEQVGRDHGCGRSFWEYEKEIGRYGTTMALMLLPHWTDGCIGSMEGLFFESSATTPFHFLNQVELSAAPSAAQRELPYDGFNFDQGVQHLQLMGVRYYLSSSLQATQAARVHPDLTEVATSGPWTIFLVANSDLVTSLVNEPAVLEEGGGDHKEWICGSRDAEGACAGKAITWFTHPDQWDVMLASSGPKAWQRLTVPSIAEQVSQLLQEKINPALAADGGFAPDVRPLEPVVVSAITAGTDTISFDVDTVGVPVLVKASYFPNWRVRGGSGPYRVAPNLMVVIPSSSQVELTYGREPVEYVAYAITAVGVGLVILLACRPPLVPLGRKEDEPPAATPGHFKLTE
ncbi:MAG: hypothetical protein EXQ71_00455 [Acidimicrobiia bacterium]|nr:hypothetical protein [Acidimicrobiia bacterium]